MFFSIFTKRVPLACVGESCNRSMGSGQVAQGLVMLSVYNRLLNKYTGCHNLLQLQMATNSSLRRHATPIVKYNIGKQSKKSKQKFNEFAN